MGSLLGGGGGGHGGLWWRPFESQQRRQRRRDSKPSDSVDRATGGGRYRFPLKQAATAGSLALAGDSIAQLRERYRKRNALSDYDAGFSESGHWQIVGLSNPIVHPYMGNIKMVLSSGIAAAFFAAFLSPEQSDLNPENREEPIGAITLQWASTGYWPLSSVFLGIMLQEMSDIMRILYSNHDWLRALRMSSYGFLLYGPGSYAWYQYLDHVLPKQSVKNLLLKILLNQIVLGPCVVAIVFAWNNLWLGKASELPNKYQKDAIPTLLTGYKFWIPVSALNFWVVPLQARVAFMSMGSIFWNFCLSATMSK